MTLASVHGSVERPMRTCVGCREQATQPNLLRVTVRAGELCPDGKRRAEGRGAYVHRKTTCLILAEKKGGFSRSFKQRIPREAHASLRTQISEGSNE